MASWAELATAVERLLLPGECLLCRSALAGREWDALVCALCRSRWPRVVPPWCDRCGQPELPGVGCRLCAGWPGALGRARAATWLLGGAREAVHALKYDGWRGAARAMAEVMAGLEPLECGTVLVPVPLGARRLRQRGYNQAAVLAEALAARTGLRVDGDRLARARETTTQTALAPAARVANLKGAFTAGVVGGGRFVLVDDVLTTGATLGSAAEALLAAGAERVEAVTFARAPVPVAGAV